jgi:purine-nucleoside phosphorylase
MNRSNYGGKLKGDMNNFQERFLKAHADRYQEWLLAAQAWIFGEASLAQQLSPYLIFVHSSEGNPEKHILPLMDKVRTHGGFPVQGGGCAVGNYRGSEIWIVHQFMGCTATQMWMECLGNTPVRYIIGLAEMTAYPEDVSVGDIVLPTTSVRGDIVTGFHAPASIPASGDLELLDRLEEKLNSSGWPVHVGPIYSGMPGGIGVNNPILREKIWRHIQAGLLGNAIETSVTYLEAQRLGIRAAEAWAVSDDIAYGVTEAAPNGRERWQHAWSLIAHAGLDVLADIAAEEIEE